MSTYILSKLAKEKYAMPESESDNESESGDRISESDDESESGKVDREFNNESDGGE